MALNFKVDQRGNECSLAVTPERQDGSPVSAIATWFKRENIYQVHILEHYVTPRRGYQVVSRVWRRTMFLEHFTAGGTGSLSFISKSMSPSQRDDTRQHGQSQSRPDTRPASWRAYIIPCSCRSWRRPSFHAPSSCSRTTLDRREGASPTVSLLLRRRCCR